MELEEVHAAEAPTKGCLTGNRSGGSFKLHGLVSVNIFGADSRYM